MDFWKPPDSYPPPFSQTINFEFEELELPSLIDLTNSETPILSTPNKSVLGNETELPLGQIARLGEVEPADSLGSSEETVKKNWTSF
jgi:hypothetical protein